MARINRISITLCALLFTTLPFTPMAHASKQARTTPTASHTVKTVDKKKSATASQKATKTNKKTATKNTSKMYHLRDAAPIERGELKNGDLVFFRTQGRGTADHVGVYVGNGKFIQSPRSGQEIQITSLSEDYWQRHYVGARRVMTPKTIR